MTAAGRPDFTYHAVYRYLATLIAETEPGQHFKLPSLRDLAKRLDVSISTVQYAYSLLETEGKIYSVARSGYYAQPPTRSVCQGHYSDILDYMQNSALRWDAEVFSGSDPTVLGTIDAHLLKLERDWVRQRALMPGTWQPYGDLALRRVLAARYTSSPEACWCAEHVYVGVDFRAVLEILCQAITVKGACVLVTSPCSWPLLRVLKSAGARVLELELGEDGSVDLNSLERMLGQLPIRLAVLSSSVNAPHGSVFTDDCKLEVASLLNHHGVWCVENDTYGELGYKATLRMRDLLDPQRLLVLGTLEKVLGAEASYGYVLSRHFTQELRQLFMQRTFRLAPIRQKAIAALYTGGHVDLYLQAQRSRLGEHLPAIAQQVRKTLVEHMHCLEPQGGATLWLRARHRVNMRQVFEQLVRQGFVIAPGEIFSLQGLHDQCLRVDGTGTDADRLNRLCQALAAALIRERER